MASPALNRQQCREIDRRAIEEFGIAGIVLMENAGRGCVDVLERIGIDGPVAILCGKGNNGGDGFVIARHLNIRGYDARVVLLASPTDLRGDAATNFAILKKCNLPIVEIATATSDHVGKSFRDSHHRVSERRDQLHTQLDHHAYDVAWLIDAILGTGATGDPRPPFDVAIDWINSRGSTTRVLAVDIPSGLDCDTGEPSAHTVRADHTCTFAAKKIGFTKLAAKPFTGEVHLCDIGVPPRLIDDCPRAI